MKKVFLFTLFLLISGYAMGQKYGLSLNEERQKLLDILGVFPQKPELKIDTLDKVRLEKGWRYTIKYLVEEADSVFSLPEDWVEAYLFVPDHNKGEKLPAMVAIHQDDVSFHLGKDEPAGLAGDSTMAYGKELYERGYIVICPDRYYHGKRRNFSKFNWIDSTGIDYRRDYEMFDNQVGTLWMQGRTHYSKEAYDQSVAVDVLCSLDGVDTQRIGAIGHSAGGVAMFYLLFYDQRVSLGVSSCGVYDIMRIYKKGMPPFPASMSMFGLAKEGYATADFFRHIAPRTMVLTRGAYEWGKDDKGSQAFIDEVEHFAENYRSSGKGGAVHTIVFEENGGGHSFPPTVKQQVYDLIDRQFQNN